MSSSTRGVEPTTSACKLFDTFLTTLVKNKYSFHFQDCVSPVICRIQRDVLVILSDQKPHSSDRLNNDYKLSAQTQKQQRSVSDIHLIVEKILSVQNSDYYQQSVFVEYFSFPFRF